jgi:hypothetical protein
MSNNPLPFAVTLSFVMAGFDSDASVESIAAIRKHEARQ